MLLTADEAFFLRQEDAKEPRNTSTHKYEAYKTTEKKKNNKPRLANPSIVVKYALLEGAVSPVYSMRPPLCFTKS